MSAWWQWQDGLQAPHASAGPELAAALERDRAVLQERLAVLVARNDVRRALELASSSVYASLGRWHQLNGRRRARLDRTLVAYLSRACTRPAPLTLFGGVGMGVLGDATRLQVPEDSHHRTVHRLDVAFAAELAVALSMDPELRDAIRYAPAPTLSWGAGRLRLVRQKAGAADRGLEAATIRVTPTLERMLSRAADGATIPQLVDAVAAGDEGRRKRGESFVTQAIEHGLLVSLLEPPVTGPEPLAYLIDELERVRPRGRRLLQLSELRRALASLDTLEHAVSTARASAARAAAAALPVSARPDAEFVDVVRTFPGEQLVLGPELTAAITEAAELTLQVGSTGWPDVLGALRERFVERYGIREVPLLELFDPELGLGVHIFEELNAPPSSLDKARRWHLLNLLVDAAAHGRAEVRLSDADLERLGTAHTLSADTTGVLVSLSGQSLDEVEVLVLSVGSEAGRLCARFGNALPELESRLHELVQREQACASDALVADVVVRDPGQLGNVVQRPQLYDYEIELIGRSGAAPDRRVGAEDLLVSVSGDRFHIRSRSRGAFIEPRQCSALTIDRRFPVIARFLWMVGQGESGPSWRWSWGELQSSLWLPRVRRGRVLLALERWLVTTPEASRLTAAATSDGRLQTLRTWREHRGVPREVDLMELDRWVRLDLENVLCVELLLSRLNSRGRAVLREAWPRAGHENAVSGPSGGIANELVVPFVRAQARVRARPDLHAWVPPAERRRTPGSEWLFLKVYGGSTGLERALASCLAPVCRELVEDRIASLWFALMHAEEGSPSEMHLRLWLRGSPAGLLNGGIGRLMHAIDDELADGRIRRVAIDTHEREIERYGGPEGLACAEVVFQADTELLTAVVDCSADRRYWLALTGAWATLDALAANGPEDLGERLRKQRDHLLRALKPPSNARAAFAGQPRSDAAVGEQWLSGQLVSEVEAAAMERWRAAADGPFDRLRAIERDGSLSLPIWSVALALAGSHAARVLAPADRPRAEAQLLDAMVRIVERRRARARTRRGGG